MQTSFDQVMDHLVAVLLDLKVPRPQIREVAYAILPLRHDIVRPSTPWAGAGLDAGDDFRPRVRVVIP